MSSINLKQLAERLGSSVSTVSRALRDSYEISEETKKRVTALAQELGYYPNPNTSSLRNQVTRTIAVVIPEVANHFFSLVINGIEEIARQAYYHLRSLPMTSAKKLRICCFWRSRTLLILLLHSTLS